MIENDFFQILKSSVSLSSLLDNNGIHYQKNTYQKQNKFIVYQVQSIGRPLNIDNSPAQKRCAMQIDIYAPTKSDVTAIRGELVTLLHAKSNNDYVSNIQHMSVDFELSNDDADTDLYRITLTINLFYN